MNIWDKMVISIFFISAVILLIIPLTEIISDNKYDVNKDGEVNSGDLYDLQKYLIENGE